MARTTGKVRDRMKNNADVTRIVTYNCRKMAICCFLLLCIKVSWRHLANLKQMLRICALPALPSPDLDRPPKHYRFVKFLNLESTRF